MTIQKALINATKKLKDKSSSAQLDAEVLLNKILKIKNKKCNKTWLYTHIDYKLSKFEIIQFKKLINRRLIGEPIAYITGHKEFYGLDFIVNTLVNQSYVNVMVPRPETEILVERATKYIGNRPFYIADIGTGSGCIAISVAKKCSNVKITATDISRQALTVAQKNARVHQVASKIQFIIGDLPTRKKYDVILANLPYLKKDQIKNELLHEPKKALYGGTEGTEKYQKLFKNIKKNLARNYLMIIEIDPKQVVKLKRIIKKFFDDPQIKIIKDYSGQNRFLKISPNR